MSIQALTWAFSTNLQSTKKFVLVALADYSNHDDEAWPSQATIAQKCGLKRQTVNRVIKELEKEGYLVSIPRKRENGSDTSCKYRLLVRDTPGVSDDDTPCHPERHPVSATMTPRTTTITTNEPSMYKGARKSRRVASLESLFLDEIDRQWAREKAPNVDPDTVLETLKDYCAAHGKTYKDYRAAWRNFMKRDFDNGKRSSGAGRADSPHAAMYAGFAAAAARFGEKESEQASDGRSGDETGGGGLPSGDGPLDASCAAAEGSRPYSGVDGPLLDAEHASQSTGGSIGGLGICAERPAVERGGPHGLGMVEDAGAEAGPCAIPKDGGTVH